MRTVPRLVSVCGLVGAAGGCLGVSHSPVGTWKGAIPAALLPAGAGYGSATLVIAADGTMLQQLTIGYVGAASVFPGCTAYYGFAPVTWSVVDDGSDIDGAVITFGAGNAAPTGVRSSCAFAPDNGPADPPTPAVLDTRFAYEIFTHTLFLNGTRDGTPFILMLQRE